MADERPAMDVARLVAEHHRAAYAYAYRLTGSAVDAEDLTQQAFLVAQQKLGQLRKAESARSWLFTVLRNCFLKDQQRRRPVPVGTLKVNIESIPDKPPKSGDIDQERLQEAIDQLPDGFRLVLVMFYFEERSYREIAKELELPIGTVMSRLARAKGHLRSRLFEPDRVGKKRRQSSGTG